MTIRCLSLRERPRGGPVVPPALLDAPGGRRIPPTGLRAARTLVLLTHGYNVPEPLGWAQLQRLAADLAPDHPDATFLAVTWPGDVNLGWLSFVGYPTEERQADEAARALATFLGDWAAPGTTVHVLAHSLGCRLALALATHLAGSRLRVGRLGLMAGAVVADGPARTDAFRRGALASERVAVLASRDDEVLRFAFRTGTALAGWFGGGSTSDVGAALGRVGPRPSASEAVPSTVVGRSVPPGHGVDHSDYLPPPLPDPRTPPQTRALGWARRLLAGDPDPAW